MFETDLLLAHADRTAIVDASGRQTYRSLVSSASGVASALLDGRDDLAETRVALLGEPSFGWVCTLLGIWQAGGIAVPLCTTHPDPELTHVLEDSDAAIVVGDAVHAPRLWALASARQRRILAIDALLAGHPRALPPVAAERRALIVYTSGTTGRPKGAVHTHASLRAMVGTLVRAWEWQPNDTILHTLPLHHMHGLVNALLCAIASGASCELLPRFDVRSVWERLSFGGITLFMGVPAMYHRLADAWERSRLDAQSAWSAAAHRLRLAVSGSAALPVALFERWRSITGDVLLERYGMTEIGMALSNPLHGQRLAGSVGSPLPGIEVRLVGEDGASTNGQGEIEVRGPSVFLEYWRQPAATSAAFRDGWFRTGDTAVIEQGRFRILGRTCIDIIKTGGFKVSALEIEDVLRTHPAVDDCAVIGVADAAFGERVAVAVTLRPGEAIDLTTLRTWAKQHLAPYKVPSQLLVVGALPRNALGKIIKPEVRAQLLAATVTE